MSPKEVLIAAREKISTPDKWCQEVYGRDAKGHGLQMIDLKNACTLCAKGAVFATSEGEYPREVLQLLHNASMSLGYDGVADLNDSSNHNTVLELFDRAIAEAGGE